MLKRQKPSAVAAIAALVAAFSGLAPRLAAEDDASVRRLDEVRTILRSTPLVDGHNDVPWQYLKRHRNRLGAIDLAADQSRLDPPLHTDFPRLRAGGVGGVFWSVYVSADIPGADALEATIEQIDVVHRLIERYPETLELALTADDVVRIHRAGKIASIIGMEGGHSIHDSLASLRMLHRLGARYLTLTHVDNLAWADAATDDPERGGLTPFGKEVVREMNRLGMLIDLSHVSAKTMHDALDASAAPVIFSHSSARALVDHPRNVPDDVLARLRSNGGAAMVTFVPAFTSEAVRDHGAREKAEEARLARLHPGDPERRKRELAAWKAAHPAPRATLSQVADHLEHVIRIAGPDHAGLGSDFDGIESVVEGLEDVSRYPQLLAELMRRGHGRETIEKVAGLNVLRALRQAEQVAARLQKERGPSEARIEALGRQPTR